jgi:hypothetical protein
MSIPAGRSAPCGGSGGTGSCTGNSSSNSIMNKKISPSTCTNFHGTNLRIRCTRLPALNVPKHWNCCQPPERDFLTCRASVQCTPTLDVDGENNSMPPSKCGHTTESLTLRHHARAAAPSCSIKQHVVVEDFPAAHHQSSYSSHIPAICCECA